MGERLGRGRDEDHPVILILLRLLSLFGKPFRWKCPRCGGIFAEIHVSMDRRRNQAPVIRSIRGDITCDSCGFKDSHDDYVLRHRRRVRA